MIHLPEIVYILCALTALACALLLARGYQRTGARILLWSAICFALSTVNNILLFFDVVILPQIDLSLARDLAALASLAVLAAGLILDVE